MQQRLHCVEPDLVVGDGDLVPAGAIAVFADDRRPQLLVRPGRGLEQDTLEVVETLGRNFGETRANRRGVDRGGAVAGHPLGDLRHHGGLYDTLAANREMLPFLTASAPCSATMAPW